MKKVSLMDSSIKISPYSESDREFLIAGNIDLQETERKISEFCLPGVQIAEKYLDHLLKLNAENSGTILVAKNQTEAVGYIACRIETDESVTTTNEYNRFGYISDAWTHPRYRKQGVFKKLNEATENYFKQFNDITIVKLNVIAGNEPAIRSYEKTGYRVQEHTLIKRIK